MINIQNKASLQMKRKQKDYNVMHAVLCSCPEGLIPTAAEKVADRPQLSALSGNYSGTSR